MELQILQVIKKYGYTVEYVANKMGISRFTLRNTIQNGNPTISTLEKISDAIGCDFFEFFGIARNNKNEVSEKKHEKIFSTFVAQETGKIYKIVEIED